MTHITRESQATAATRVQGRQRWKTNTSVKSHGTSSRRCSEPLQGASKCCNNILYSLLFCTFPPMLPCRRKPSDYEQIVVAPAHPGVQTMESQLNEENVDYASRHRYHHSTTLQTSSRFQQHSDDSEWTAKGSTISATMPATKQLPESKFTSTYTHTYRRPSQGQITTCTSARLVTNQAHFNCCSVNLLQWSLVTLPALPIAKGHNYSPQVKLW